MFRGTTTALVTPFKHGKIDFDAYKKLIDHQLQAGVNGLLVCGSTGEANCLSYDERIQLISTAIKHVNGTVPIMASTGAPSTSETIELSRVAADIGANALLVIAPFYLKPSQAGIIAHFEALTSEIDIPVYIYNNPGRCAVDISVSTVKKLSELKNVIGIKDSGASLTRAMQLKNLITKPDFDLLAGDDALAFSFIALGWDGVISVVSNTAPLEVTRMVNNALRGNLQIASEEARGLIDLFEAAFCESNPIPVKYMVSRLELIENELRLPLMTATEQSMTLIDEQMKKLGLI